jgi:hypothetical protein
MTGWALDTISQELTWAIVIVALIAVVAAVSLLRK